MAAVLLRRDAPPTAIRARPATKYLTVRNNNSARLFGLYASNAPQPRVFVKLGSPFLAHDGTRGLLSR